MVSLRGLISDRETYDLFGHDCSSKDPQITLLEMQESMSCSASSTLEVIEYTWPKEHCQEFLMRLSAVHSELFRLVLKVFCVVMVYLLASPICKCKKKSQDSALNNIESCNTYHLGYTERVI